MPESPAQAAGNATAGLSVVTVTFNPETTRLQRQLAALPSDAFLVLVDNASDAEQLTAIREIAGTRNATILLENNTNRGLARALNQGTALARERQPERPFLLFLDQDSVPETRAVETLLAEFERLSSYGLPVGCVGPNLVDDDTGLTHGFHCIRGWRWARTYADDQTHEPVECANLNGSGTLLRFSLLDTLGGLEEEFFIDHVDTEWAFRVRAAGLRLYGIPQASLHHRMGSRGIRYWCFGWRVWPWRTAPRHFYLFRNAACLLRRDYVPAIWKLWAVPKLLLTLLVHAAVDRDRTHQVGSMFRGFITGWRRDSQRGQARASPPQ
jgi:rhamnosyltransferase